jgi:hypothetical protein
MKVLFGLWGGIGFLGNLLSLINMFATSSIGVGTSAYAAAVALIWIGGMLFFGLGAIVFRRTDAAPFISN